MQNAVELGGNKLNSVLKQTGMTLRELELMSANNSKGFKEVAQSLGMTSTELKQLITAGTNLEDFAKVSNMTTEQFKKAWKEDAAGALTEFIKGLGDAESKGESAITMLSEMGLTEVRLRDSLLRAANAGDLLNSAIETGTKAFEENNALTKEANKRYETLSSKMKISLNKLQDIGITLGNKLMPALEKVLNKVGEWANKFDKLDDKQVELIVTLGLLVGALSPVISTIGKMTTGIGNVITAYGNFREGLGLLIKKAEESGSAMTGILTAIQSITGPSGIACAAIVAAVTGIAIAVNETKQKIQDNFSTMGNSAQDFITGIDSAKSHLSDFNSILLASSEEQQQLEQQMDEVQKGITNICKTASDERRGYTQEEITQLDEYFQKLRELNEREIQIQQSISQAITQQAVTNAEVFQGSLEEYKNQSQEWLKTAEDQKNKTIDIINKQSIEEVALLNQRYGDQANMQNEAYAAEYNRILENKSEKIAQAQSEIAEVSRAYTDGYAKRSQEQDSFYNKIKQANTDAENENNRHAAEMEKISNTKYQNERAMYTAQGNELKKYQENSNSIWVKLYQNMSEEQAKELGTWLGMLSQTEMYGGEISEENKEMVRIILDSYDKMPSGAKEKMKQTMEGMMSGMREKEPTLFAKATGIADGILSRLRKTFDIHSPSRKTRKIFQQAMEGAELGLEDKEKDLYKEAEEIANNINDTFSEIDTSSNNIPQYIGKKQNINTSAIELIDYEKLFRIFLRALNSCKIEIDKDGFIHFIDNRLMEVM